MSKYCGKCGELMGEDEGTINGDGIVICELCLQDEKSLKDDPEEPDVFEDSELELLEDDLDDVIDDDLDDDDLDDYDEDDDDDYGYTNYRNNYSDEENDLYEGLVDQERSFF